MSSRKSELQYEKVILFGDSITEYAYDPKFGFCFGSAMQNVYTRKFDVLQRGFSGYNSENAKILLPKLINIENQGNSKIALLIVFFGSNDAALGGPEKVDLDRFEENMISIVQYVKRHGIKLVLIGPGFHNPEVWNLLTPDDVAQGIIRSTENNRKYANALDKITGRYEVPYVNMFKLFERYSLHANYDDLLYDGIHFNGKGYKLMFDAVIDTIESYYPELAPNNIIEKLPHWKNVTNSELETV